MIPTATPTVPIILAWQRGYGLTDSAAIIHGDADGNGGVNENDLTIWTTNYQIAANPVALAAAAYWEGLNSPDPDEAFTEASFTSVESTSPSQLQDFALASLADEFDNETDFSISDEDSDDWIASLDESALFESLSV